MLRLGDVITNINTWATCVLSVHCMLGNFNGGQERKPQDKMPNPNNSTQTGSSTDPRRPNKIFRYKPLANKPTDDPTPDYMNLLGMIFSMCGLMMKLKWAAWAAVYCSFISFANARSSEDTKQMFSSFLLSVSAVVMSYLQNPQPMAASW